MPILIYEMKFFLFSEIPVVILLNRDLWGNLNIRIVLIELLLVLLGVELGLHGGLLHLILLVLALGPVLVVGLLLLLCYPVLVRFEVGSVVIVELFLGIFDVLDPGFFSFACLLFALITVLAGALAVGFSVDDVRLSGVDGELEPFVKFSKRDIVLFNQFDFVSCYDFLTVVDLLIEFEYAFFGAKNFVRLHLLGYFVLDQIFGGLPEEELGLRLAKLLPGESE